MVQAEPPANDNFADAVQLFGEYGTVTGTNVEATSEVGEPSQYSTINSIWYAWTAPNDGYFTFDTLGSYRSTYLSVFQGNVVNMLSTVGQISSLYSHPTGAIVGLKANAGETFHIAIDGQDQAPSTGNVILNYQPASEVLLKDINVSVNSSYPDFLSSVNETLFFRANDGNTRELWRTDGSEAGTVRLKDAITPISSATNVNNTYFFVRTDPLTGGELWRSDGTEAGTTLLKDINPGIDHSHPSELIKINDVLYFIARDGVNGDELWRSDGTMAGTTLIKDINPGVNGSLIKNLTNVNGTLYFQAFDPVHGSELWRSDGTEEGTVLVKNIASGANSSSPFGLISVNGTLFFRANDEVNGYELWRSDGTEVGTMMVKDINPGPSSSHPYRLININGVLYFAAYDEENGIELWRSDGTEDGTSLAYDILPGTHGSSPSQLINVNGMLLFSADDGVHGRELWRSDGTEEGTVLVKNIASGANSSSLSHLTSVNGTLFFRANDEVNGYELWRSDGTEGGTSLAYDILPGTHGTLPSQLINVNGMLFFVANEGFGSEIYKYKDVISNFTDVPPGSFGFQFIENFFAAGVTGGCGANIYCPDDPVTRGQMAVFLEKASRGASFTPPPASGVFNDVNITSGFAPWIEQLAVDGITGGCGPNIYCPDRNVTRAQMAVFIEKALRGSGYIPPSATGQFSDVPISNPFAPWIEKLAADGITGGCGTNIYCPDQGVTRAQMAIFLVKAFNLGFVK